MIVRRCNLIYPLSLFFSLCQPLVKTAWSADTVVSINDVVWTKTEIPASFPRREEAWDKFMFKVLKKNIDALTDEGKSGTCRVKFIVDTTGKVSKVEALNMKGSVPARIVVDAIINGPKWMPSQQNRSPCKSV